MNHSVEIFGIHNLLVWQWLSYCCYCFFLYFLLLSLEGLLSFCSDRFKSTLFSTSSQAFFVYSLGLAYKKKLGKEISENEQKDDRKNLLNDKIFYCYIQLSYDKIFFLFSFTVRNISCVIKNSDSLSFYK